MKRIVTIAIVAGLLVACSKHQKLAAAPIGGSDDEAAAADETIPDNDPNQAQLVISDRIREACGITETDAYFDYNSDHLSAPAESVLKKLATCFTTGPLSGESMLLIGHADPRGSDEYNLVLGSRRAENVKRTLSGFGLANDKASTTSRGEMDAQGTDEGTWVHDRKVEVLLDG